MADGVTDWSGRITRKVTERHPGTHRRTYDHTYTPQGFLAGGGWGKVTDIAVKRKGDLAVSLAPRSGILNPLETQAVTPVEQTTFGYDANGNMTSDKSRGIKRMTYNALNLPERAEFSDGSHTTWAYTALGVKLGERHVSADGLSDRVTRYMGGMVFVDGWFDRYETPWGYVRDGAAQFHAYIRDYQGSIVGVVNTSVASRPLTQFTDYYPYGLPHDDATGVSVNRRKFGGKEYMTESGLNELDYGVRHMLPQYGCFTSPDPKAIENTAFSPWAYCNGDPVNNTDPTGMAVIYKLNGDYIGHSSEGFNGEVVIYTGLENVDFSKFSYEELMNLYPFDLYPFDVMVTGCIETFTEESISNILTNVVSHFNGILVYDEVFDIKRIAGEKIGYKVIEGGNWETIFTPGRSDILPAINGDGRNSYKTFPYETTVENIASSIIIHEWYSHGIKHLLDSDHTRVFQNVINFECFYKNTTDSYKSYNQTMLQMYKIKK